VVGGVRPPGPAPVPEDSGDEGERIRALLHLRELPGVGDAGVARLVEQFEGPEEALSAGSAAFAEVAGAEAEAARSNGEIRVRVETALRVCGAEGIRILSRWSPGYPPGLLHLARPPAILFLLGREELLRRGGVAVVGSRRSTAYGRRVAREIAAALVEAGLVVVSGLALGIDAAAHRGALEAGGATLAVLGNGVDVLHPPSNRGLARRLGREGLLVSEFLPGTRPLPHHFPRRNRILAALSTAVVVVEAARRSGALITADLALELGRDIAAVPGSVYAPMSEGANRLIRVGAHPLLRAGDVVELPAVSALLDGVERHGAHREPADPGDGPAPQRDGGSAPGWTGSAPSLLVALGSEPRGLDELARESGLSPGRLAATLATLEIQGRVERMPGSRYVRIRRP
jgi:DNA processing protein